MSCELCFQETQHKLSYKEDEVISKDESYGPRDVQLVLNSGN